MFRPSPSDPLALIRCTLSLLVIACALADRVQGADERDSAAQPAAKERLRYAGRSLAEWQEVLETDLDPAYRLKAIEAISALGRHGHAGEAVATLRKRAVGALPFEADAAIRGLGTLGPSALGPLTSLLKDPAVPRKTVVLAALAELGPSAEPVMTEIISLTHDEEISIRREALLAMLRIGRPEKQVVDALRTELLKLPGQQAANASLLEAIFLEGLQQSALSPDARSALLIELLGSPEPAVRTFAARALTWLAIRTPQVKTALFEHYRVQVRGELPLYLSPTFADRADNELIFEVTSRALQELDLASPQVRGSQLVRNYVNALQNHLRSGRVLQSRAVEAQGTPLRAESLVPFAVLVLDARQDQPLTEVDQQCLELLREIGRPARSAMPAIGRAKEAAATISSDNTRRFWETLIQQTTNAIGAGSAD